MDNRNLRHNNWWGGRNQPGLKGRPPPRLANPPHPLDVHSPQDELINYIYDAWDKISRSGASVWEPPRPPAPPPPLQPLDLQRWLGQYQRSPRSPRPS